MEASLATTIATTLATTIGGQYRAQEPRVDSVMLLQPQGAVPRWPARQAFPTSSSDSVDEAVKLACKQRAIRVGLSHAVAASEDRAGTS